MTFSLVARCAETGMFGVAISSSSPAVAARCSFARAGVGAVASQNVTNPSLGPLTLERMQAGASATEAVTATAEQEEHAQYRQLLAIDTTGRTAIHSGHEALGIWSQAEGTDVAAAGNLLANADVPAAIVDAFERSEGHLGNRLLDALRAGSAAGGEAGPVHSAGLLLVSNVSWPVADLRCDWTDDCPIASLDHLWEIYKPQLNDYVRRALAPAEAPSYGVPGDI
ncbi:DUF1028 domain-containing protein [Phaeobacter sp.]|uniref:DUF1028 domain-containing protein n=1 Tax=Phaeobacter sp. TaxID=1902409 RepID=UPI0025D42B32|nr:DUF1028 domain-containing protein [Phaeobacter sp.]